MKFANSPYGPTPWGPVAAAVSGESLGIEAVMGNSFDFENHSRFWRKTYQRFFLEKKNTWQEYEIDFFPTRRGENGLALSGQICRSEKKSPGHTHHHLLDGFVGGENPLGRYFWDPVLEIIRNKNTPKVNRISPHSGDVFMTVWEGLFALASCIPEGRSKDRERGGKEREKEEKDYPCAYIYHIYI